METVHPQHMQRIETIEVKIGFHILLFDLGPYNLRFNTQDLVLCVSRENLILFYSNPQLIQQKLLKADFHGAILTGRLHLTIHYPSSI